MNVLVDTSVWSLSLRRKPGDLNRVERSCVAELTELISEGRVCLLGLIRQEVLSGIRTPAQFGALRAVLRAFPDVTTDTSDFEGAAEASNKCQSKGVTVSVVDALVCAVALNRGWTILTTDADFEHHARILPIQLHMVRE
ncbi:MAG: PIN domain-containing protein [Candidatus Acidiferrum sp.]